MKVLIAKYGSREQRHVTTSGFPYQSDENQTFELLSNSDGC